jgi:heat shock protein HspQ
MSEPKVIKPRKPAIKKLPAEAPVTRAGDVDQAASARAAKRIKATAKPDSKPIAPAPRRRAKTAKYAVGTVVRHRVYPFRGVVFDIDPVFDNTEEWWLSIPEDLRPKKNQPFYHLLAENDQTEYIAYVSEQNLLPDSSGAPLRHPKVAELFVKGPDGRYRATYFQAH